MLGEDPRALRPFRGGRRSQLDLGIYFQRLKVWSPAVLWQTEFESENNEHFVENKGGTIAKFENRVFSPAEEAERDPNRSKSWQNVC